MFKITEYSVEKLNDPFGILSGDRYEFYLDIEVDEEDDMYTEQGLYIRVLYSVENGESRIVKYEVFEKGEEKYLDFELEDDELAAIEEFCRSHYSEAV